MSLARGYKLVEDLEGRQLEAATARGNVVVAAGAGSGKTTVLAARYVHLLATGAMASGERVGPRNILVLTFTRKAAAEMYSRIYGALALAAARAGGPEKAAARDEGLADHLAACLADFSQAQISTFDAFAARVARSGSSRFGVAPDFAVDEERAARMAGDLALSFILERREEEAMRDLVASTGLEGARDDVLAALALARMPISSPPGFEGMHSRQATRLEELASRTKERLVAMRAAALDYSGSRTTPTSRAWLDAFDAFPEDAGRRSAPSEELFLAYLDRLIGLRKPASNSRDEVSLFLSDCVPAVKAAAAEYRDLAATRAAHPGRLSLYRLLDDYRERWDALRRREKTLTFRDVARLSLDALESDPDLRRHYGNLFRFVMIDEFQDDDELQKRVLFLIAGLEDKPREGSRAASSDRLFFVGDEKQSIYLFRGADVSVFRRLAEELSSRGAAENGAIAPTAGELPLSLNFRSEPGVIDMINAIFPTVMAARDAEGGREDFEARFEPLESRKPTPGVRPRLVYLELPRVSEGDAGREGALGKADELRSSAEAEAWEVARIVRDAVEGGSLLVADRRTGAARKARYEDFAVLLRSTGNQVHFEKYFRFFGVPYGSENACGLFSEAVACDLYYALRLAIYPEDRNALAAYLTVALRRAFGRCPRPYPDAGGGSIGDIPRREPAAGDGRPPSRGRPAGMGARGRDDADPVRDGGQGAHLRLSGLPLVRDRLSRRPPPRPHSLGLRRALRARPFPGGRRGFARREPFRLRGRARAPRRQARQARDRAPARELPRREDHDHPQEQGPRVPRRHSPAGEQRRPGSGSPGPVVLGGRAGPDLPAARLRSLLDRATRSTRSRRNAGRPWKGPSSSGSCTSPLRGRNRTS